MTLVPGASEVGLGAAALAPLWWDPRGSAAEFREVTFYAQASQTLEILTEKVVHVWLFLSSCLFLFDSACCGCVRLVKLVSKKFTRASNVIPDAQISNKSLNNIGNRGFEKEHI